MVHLDRRQFLQASVVGTATLLLNRLQLVPGIVAAAESDRTTAGAVPDVLTYRSWEDVYRQQWVWDRVGRSTHFVNCWQQSHCAWSVYVKDGMVWREEQVAGYPRVRADVPDFNPRGCQKGACFSERMYDPSRVRWPLKRVGERGSGQWQRVSWDDALSEIADAVLDTISGEGSDRVIWDCGPLYTFGTMSAAHQRLAYLLDSTTLDPNTEIGDGRRGVAETFGKIVFDRSADDYFFSDLILIWGGNPIATQIPNSHFLLEARYKGATLVCIAPDYNPSSIHADLWVPVRPGSDAALALSIAHEMIASGRFDRAFVREQTDLPLLVREDTGRYLRGSDFAAGGDPDQLFLHDATRGVVAAPRRSLALDGLEPDLEGRFEVKGSDGRRIVVRPVFERLREHLAAYAPEKATTLCGTPPALIRRLAAMMLDAKAAATVSTSNFSKYYHGNLIERAQILVFALAGQFGRKGSGFAGFPMLLHDGLEKTTLSVTDLATRAGLIARVLSDRVRLRLAGYTPEMIEYERARDALKTGMYTSGALFWYVHGGVLEASEKLQQWDPHAKRSARAMLDESLSKGWQYLWPKPGNDPRVMFVYGSNPLRRVRSYPLLLKHLWPKLRQIVTLDWRMSSTARFSDFVLPVAAWYERTEHKWVTTLMPFIHAGEKLTSYYEAKSDWEILSLLAQKVQQRARERGLATFVDRQGNERPLDTVWDHYSESGRFGPTDDDAVAGALIGQASNLEGVTWEALKQQGFARFTGVGEAFMSVGNACDIRPDDTITPLTKHVVDKMPYPTLSRRIQFLIDHELYREMGEELPAHKDSPTAGGAYPLMLTGGHTRWSIHAAWRDDRLMLRQQRGQPVMYTSVDDARARGIADGDRVRVWNDRGAFHVMAKTSPALRPGQLILYHAWENHQFEGGAGFQNLIPSPLNPVELAGGQFHLRPMPTFMQPSHTDRDTRVDIEKA
jgi:DMSO reductase family type II enzyme molybdopterin subunit